MLLPGEQACWRCWRSIWCFTGGIDLERRAGVEPAASALACSVLSTYTTMLNWR